MNGRHLTDGQISQALRAHVSDHAPSGLRERILESTETTVQQRALPSFFGALTDADPVIRQRSLLLAAALLVALAFASVAAIGAWQLHRDPLPQLHLERPADIPAFVLSIRDRMPQLPPVAFTTLESDGTMDRIDVDRSGAVRVESYASADATEPSRTTILSGTSVGQTVHVGPNKVWVVNDGEIGEDPRGYIAAFTGLYSVGGPGCETSLDPSEAGSATAATGWRYVGAESVAGRPAHHLACAGIDLWIDDATGLFLRVRQPATDDAGNPIPGAFKTTEITKIDFAEQPAGLFALLTPPTGVPAMSNEEYGNLCPGDTIAFGERACSGTPPAAVAATPEPAPTPSPTPTPRPDPSDCPIPSRPSAPAGPLTWTQASLRQDWPAPVRAEPAGGASVLSMPPTYIDPAGDTGSDPFRCVDIRDVTVGDYGVSLKLVANPPPGVDPSNAWIAYGVVVDENGDGAPDWRYGIDNMPDKAGDTGHHHRAWRTNLHTGQTESDPGRIDHPFRGEDGHGRSAASASVGTTYLNTSYPAGASGSDPGFRFGASFDTTAGEQHQGVKMDKPFYVWASMIVDGRVVATDYAPDTGWLLSTPGANPGGTYVTGVGRLRISMSVPDGWTAGQEGAGLQFMTIDEPLAIGCDRGEGPSSEVQVGPSVDDLVTFLEGLQTKKISDKTDVALKISRNTDVTVDGYHGRYLEYTATVRDDECNPGDPWPAIGDGDDQSAWILDVNGVRLVIYGFWPTDSETVKAEIHQIVDSIHIGP